MVSETQLVYMAIQIIYIILGIAFFFGLYLVSSYILKYLKRNRHKRLLNSTEYLPKEETQTLKQVFYLIIITLCFVDILYSLVFWSTGILFSMMSLYH